MPWDFFACYVRRTESKKALLSSRTAVLKNQNSNIIINDYETYRLVTLP
nr:MAG TPA: hypothetical protein [Caudoviricetes sp.]